MKCLIIFLTTFLVTIAVNARHVENELSENLIENDLAKTLENELKILRDYLKTIEDELERVAIMEAISEFEQLQNSHIPSSNVHVRRKRQATTDCNTLSTQLASMQAQIATQQIKISNTTIDLNKMNANVATYTALVATNPTSTNKLLLERYTSMATSLSTTLASQKSQLLVLQQSQQDIINSQTANGCLTTSTSTSSTPTPCPSPGGLQSYQIWNSNTCKVECMNPKPATIDALHKWNDQTCAVECINPMPATIDDLHKWNDQTCAVECINPMPTTIDALHKWNDQTCAVECIATQSATMDPTIKAWDANSCSEVCKIVLTCTDGKTFMQDKCECRFDPPQPCCDEVITYKAKIKSLDAFMQALQWW